MPTVPRSVRRAAIGATVVALVGAACSSSSSKSAQSNSNNSTNVSQSTGAPTTATTVARPPGPKANLSQELTGGQGVFMGEAITPNLATTGYVQREYVASGTATSYKAVGTTPTHDGRWTLAPANRAAYRTRVLVRRPAKASAFSGTVVVEWLNVSGGVDADPDWTSTSEEIMRSGDIYVGVSAQQLGVMGGPVLVSVPGNKQAAQVAGKGLRKIDPTRYGSLHHPGDGYSFDIYTQVARALRDGGAPLGGATPQRVIAMGESQSAIAIVSYIDGVQPLTHAFDGFLVHSRGASGLPITAGNGYADIAGSIGSTSVILRTDTTVPILDIQTESDITGVLNSYVARQPDSDRFRLWEVAGTAHADRHLLGATANTIHCGLPVNNGPMHIVAKAALHALVDWVQSGVAPPHAPRIELADTVKRLAKRNSDGIAIGGIRTPPVDVPVDVLSGVPGPNPAVICILLGSTKPLSAARLAQLYPSRATYVSRYNADADRVINEGFVLKADRPALLAFAQPSRVAG